VSFRDLITRLAIVCPSYDKFTRYWWEGYEFASLGLESQGGLMLLGGSRASPTELLDWAKHLEGSGTRAIVFVGHGANDALLTAPMLGESRPDLNGKHSVLISSQSLSAYSFNSEGCFAYSCSSARMLGELFGKCCGGFIGFLDEIPFSPVEGSSALEPVYLEIFLFVIRKIAEEGSVNHGVWRQVREFYGECIDGLRDAALSDEYARRLRMTLRWQLEDLTLWEGQDDA